MGYVEDEGQIHVFFRYLYCYFGVHTYLYATYKGSLCIIFVRRCARAELISKGIMANVICSDKTRKLFVIFGDENREVT
jgi:hypothetical protein